MQIVRRIIVYTAILILAGVLGANVYNSVVDAQNWGAAIPESLDAAKTYFAHANPGTFYRMFSPTGQISALLALIAVWPAGKKVRIFAGAALLLAVSGDVLTFAYFYPRNAIMFGPEQHSVAELREAWSGWNTINWARSAVCLVAVISELAVLSNLERYFAGKSLK